VIVVGLEDIVEETFISSPHLARPVQVAQRKEAKYGYAPARSGVGHRCAQPGPRKLAGRSIYDQII